MLPIRRTDVGRHPGRSHRRTLRQVGLPGAVRSCSQGRLADARDACERSGHAGSERDDDRRQRADVLLAPRGRRVRCPSKSRDNCVHEASSFVPASRSRRCAARRRATIPGRSTRTPRRRRPTRSSWRRRRPSPRDCSARTTRRSRYARRVRSAGAAMITFSVARGAIALPSSGTGVLVPLATPWSGDGSMMTTAVTFLDRKWPHLRRERRRVAARARGTHRRPAVGRDERRRTRGPRRAPNCRCCSPPSSATPLDVLVQRWPDGLAAVLHRARVHGEDARGPPRRRSASTLCGNSYDGVGVPASIGSGRRAGRDALELCCTQNVPLNDSEVVAGVDVDARHAFADVHRVVLRIVIERESDVEALVTRSRSAPRLNSSTPE